MGEPVKYKIVHIVEAVSGAALNAFCAATPRVFSERDGYRVISRTTGPAEYKPLGGGMAYMDKIIDPTPVTYVVPTKIRGWLDRFLERQGYEAVVTGYDEDQDRDVYTVMTRDQATDAYLGAVYEEEVSDGALAD